jgi:hypothetical protein
MRTCLAATLIIGLLPAPAYSQDEQNKKPTLRSDAQKKEDAAIEKEYQDMINRTKGKGASGPPKNDPWQTIRPSAGDNSKR